MTDFARHLAIMRHADAAPGRAGIADRTRELTARGTAQAQGRASVVTRFAPDLILCSSATRARQTLAALGEPGGTVLVEDGIYEASATDLLLRLTEVEEPTGRVLVIGHLPTVQAVAEALAAEAIAPSGFSPAAIAILGLTTGWADLTPGAGHLVELYS